MRSYRLICALPIVALYSQHFEPAASLLAGIAIVRNLDAYAIAGSVLLVLFIPLTLFSFRSVSCRKSTFRDPYSSSKAFRVFENARYAHQHVQIFLYTHIPPFIHTRGTRRAQNSECEPCFQCGSFIHATMGVVTQSQWHVFLLSHRASWNTTLSRDFKIRRNNGYAMACI